MSNFVEKEEWTQLNHCTQVHKLEGKMELKCAQVLLEGRNPKARRKRGKQAGKAR